MPNYSRRIDLPGQSSEALYRKVSDGIDQFLEKIPVGKVDVERDAARREVHVRSSLFSATLACGEQSVQFDAQLGMVAALFRSHIDQGIDAWLERAFRQPAAG